MQTMTQWCALLDEMILILLQIVKNAMQKCYSVSTGTEISLMILIQCMEDNYPKSS
jgi:hypothetical protein